jgi:Zn ribbon nucleic-acid-binding protein
MIILIKTCETLNCPNEALEIESFPEDKMPVRYCDRCGKELKTIDSRVSED